MANLTLHAQTEPAPEPDAMVNGRSAHERIDSWIEQTVDDEGKPIERRHVYTTLATGLHYWENGEWRETVPVFETVPGAFVVRRGPHQVILAQSLAEPVVVDLLTPDGRRLQSSPAGLAWHDRAKGTSALIGKIKPAQGLLVADNVALWPDAFEGVAADLRAVYTMAGFEWDAVLREAPPGPEQYGLDPQTSELQVWTEFFATEATDRRAWELPTGEKALTVSFGAMSMRPGQAGMAVGAEGMGEPGAPVIQWFGEIEGRTFLVESLTWERLQPLLQALPARDDQAAVTPETGSREELLRRVPVRHARAGGKADYEARRERLWSQREGKPTETKRSDYTAGLTSRPGVVVDYQIVASTPSYTFQSDVTYYCTNSVNLSGTVTFRPGTVIKFSPGGLSGLVLASSVTLSWQGEMYRPIVLTARDDNSVGEWIANSTGNPSGYYAETALTLNGGAAGVYLLKHLRISHAQIGLQAVNYQQNLTLRHAQFVNCQAGCKMQYFSTGKVAQLQNVLMAGVQTNFLDSYHAAVTGEHLTLAGAAVLQGSRYNPSYATFALTNSLLVNVTNSSGYSGTVVNDVMGSLSTYFTSVGAGHYYLPEASPWRRAGASIAAQSYELYSQLCGLTTTAPGYFTNLASGVTLSQSYDTGPSVPRGSAWMDDNWEYRFDLGYHYPPIDMVMSGCSVSNATLRLRPGAVWAAYGTHGLRVEFGGKLEAQGDPLQPIRFVRYPAVQEQPWTWGETNYPTILTGPPRAAVSGDVWAQLNLRFVDFSVQGGYGDLFYSGNSYYIFSDVAVRDCQFHAGGVRVSGGIGSVVGLTNNLFEATRSSFLYWPTIAAYNNFLQRGTLTVDRYTAAGTWTLKDNAFHNCTFTLVGTSGIVNGYNAYLGSSQTTLPNSSGGDFDLDTAFSYARGPLGEYYHLSTNLVDRGSRTAADAGLYYFTTRTDQVKDADGLVDIGFHYPAFGKDLAIGGGVVSQVSVYANNTPAAKAVDGGLSGIYSTANTNSVSYTGQANEAWWQIDFGYPRSIDFIHVWNRTDAGIDRLSNFCVFVSDNELTNNYSLSYTSNRADVATYYFPGQCGRPSTANVGRTGRFVRVQLTGNNYLHMAEVEIMADTQTWLSDADNDTLYDYAEDLNGNGWGDVGETGVYSQYAGDWDAYTDQAELAAGSSPIQAGSRDADAVTQGLNCRDASSTNAIRLGYWRFNHASLTNEAGVAPWTNTCALVQSFDRTAAAFTNANHRLVYPCQTTNGQTVTKLIDFWNGTLRLTYVPDWYHGNASDQPGAWATLVEAGDWKLRITPDGRRLVFQTPATNGMVVTNLVACLECNPVSAGRPAWELELSYGPGGCWVRQNHSLLYSDGGVLGGRPVQGDMPESMKAAGLAIGASPTGQYPCLGFIDELETFSMRLCNPHWITFPERVWYRPQRQRCLLSAQALSSALELTFLREWEGDWSAGSAANYQVLRREADQTAWTTAHTCLLSAVFSDADAQAGKYYQYRMQREAWWADTEEPSMFAALRGDAIARRGRVLVLVDSTLQTSLATNLAGFTNDLAAEGWIVSVDTATRHNDAVDPRSTNYTALSGTHRTNLVNLKAKIAGAFTNYLGDTNVVILVGHITVPYSGLNEAEDGHGDHTGPWTADLYYGDLTGNWTDTGSYTGNANHYWDNLPGDGRWDPSIFPSEPDGTYRLEVAVGRIDFARMPAFTNATYLADPHTDEATTEVALLKNYFDKLAKYRRNQTTFTNRVALYMNDLAFEYLLDVAQVNASHFYGESIDAYKPQDIFKLSQPCLWGIHGGYGHFTRIKGQGGDHYTTDFFINDANGITNKTVFNVLEGSYFAEWNTSHNPDNFMQACLGAKDYGLAVMWCRGSHNVGPWRFDRMALGAHLGQALQDTIALPRPSSSRGLFILGDPTIRSDYYAPPTALSATRAGTTVNLSWTGNSACTSGYRIWCTTNRAEGAWARLADTTGTTYAHTNAATSITHYLVRGMRLESNSSGSYTNLSLGTLRAAP